MSILDLLTLILVSLWSNAISNSFELKCRIVHRMLLGFYTGASYTASPQDAGVGESWWAGVVFSERQPTLVCGTLSSLRTQLSILTRWHILSGVGPLWFSNCCFAYNVNNIFSTCGACSEVHVNLDKEQSISVSRAKHMLAPLGMPKWVWPSMNQYKVFFVQTSTLLPLSIHQKFTKHGRCCM